MPDTLFHYTSLPSLALILRNRTIRFTRLDGVDDPQERRTADSRNLAKFRFVSCWTDSSEESIPMWREYAGVELGVRIELPVDPFMRYGLTDGDLQRAGGRFNFVSSPEGEMSLRLPFSRLWDEGPFVPEAASGVEILHEVEYTDDPARLFPKVIGTNPDGSSTAVTSAVGVAKSTAWAYQREWRYVLTAFPFALGDDDDTRGEAARAVRDAVFDRREPDLPGFLDLGVSDEAFAAMRVTASPGMTAGGRVILESLIDRYNPSASVADSGIEL